MIFVNKKEKSIPSMDELELESGRSDFNLDDQGFEEVDLMGGEDEIFPGISDGAKRQISPKQVESEDLLGLDLLEIQTEETLPEKKPQKVDVQVFRDFEI